MSIIAVEEEEEGERLPAQRYLPALPPGSPRRTWANLSCDSSPRSPQHHMPSLTQAARRLAPSLRSYSTVPHGVARSDEYHAARQEATQYMANEGWDIDSLVEQPIVRLL